MAAEIELNVGLILTDLGARSALSEPWGSRLLSAGFLAPGAPAQCGLVGGSRSEGAGLAGSARRAAAGC